MEKTQQDSATTNSQPNNKPSKEQGSENAPIEFSLDDLSFSENTQPISGDKIQKTRADADLVEDLNSIPDKMAFKIGEAAELLGVKQYVLRYWETEFEALRPRKSKNNQRVYTRRDVETAMLIKKLLYTDRFSIEGARVALKQLKSQVKDERNWHAVAQGQMQIAERVRGLISDIRAIRESLS